MELALILIGTIISFYFLVSLFEYIITLLESPQYLKERYTKLKFGKIPAFIGGLILMYFGIKNGFLYFIPDSWGASYSDGVFVNAKISISIFIIIFFTIYIIPIFEKVENKLTKIRLIEEENDLWKEYGDEFMKHFESLDKWGKKLIIHNKLQTLKRIEEGKLVTKLSEEAKKENERINILALKNKNKLKKFLESIPEDLQLALINNKLNERLKNIRQETMNEKKKEEERKRQENEKNLQKAKVAKKESKLLEYRKALNTATNRKQFKTIENIEAISEENIPYFISPELVNKKWEALDGRANAMFALTEEDIKSGTKPLKSVNPLIKACAGIEVIEPLMIVAEYSGDNHGGKTEMYTEVNGEKINYLEALILNQQINVFTLIEVFYIVFELPTKGAFWHGLQGIDYSFLLEDSQLIHMFSDLKIGLDGKEIDSIDRPCGMRVTKKGSNYYAISCLAIEPVGRIIDKSVIINESLQIVSKEDVVIRQGSAILY